ncbi:peroxide stress protein YaaA [Pigmentiphaga sp. GD03639]|uniref:peroxide stress protein YaaA n=1 Tax=Pigmentiphaga sp. GD03639 TaxID=2975354 RepID=UPI00244C0CD3|nr:peroxide stress protein YaaA [Pigmentiphaga sp. GD03639]MDH2234692.1 peroxide stress protein YaaA [Pigmentiphaga sp. GD03639]
MLFLLSPAKKLDYDTPAHVETSTQPLFVDRAKKLISVLKTKSADDVASLMDLSPALAELNVARYAKWTPKFTAENAKQAVLAFNGDVYEGLDAGTLTARQLDWAQEHVVILSGLYGALRPLDLMQPYRLEMGTRLATPKGKNLYEYWGSELSDYLNQRQEADRHPVVVNLASEEYFKAVDRKALKARVIQCVFEDWKGGAYKVISFHAKRARGLMARHAIEKRIAKPEGLQGFDAEGYGYDASASSPDRLVFRRKAA